YGTTEYLDLVARYELKTEVPRLLELAILKASSPVGSDAARLLFEFNANKQIKIALAQQPGRIIEAISAVGTASSLDMLEGLLLSPASSEEVRKLSASALGGS